ncbi:MAG TPA: nucleotidyl transferase AbiEii/AbiGii toxin family protein [Treponemataceae bacterium]|nr:nucleotidyl transferase AbiEii/AbiGii toxin family protein [Treponemataceae bacterium]
MKKDYRDKVSLLINTIPHIAKESCFALKGGTAINLFYLDMPRLSVDIDLTYIKFDDRSTAYMNINKALERISKSLIHNGYSSVIQGNSEEKKIIVSDKNSSIKIEPNYTIRGCIYSPEVKTVCKKAENQFGYAEIQIVSPAELYGGKMCAALDRQHPRDMFDLQNILSVADKETDLIKGFLAMMLGHNKPVHELLNPKAKDQTEILNKEFTGMTDTDFSCKDHTRIFNELVEFVKIQIIPYKEFLLSFVSLEPDFSSIDIPNLERMPSVLWKLHNLEKLKKTNISKFNEQYEKIIELI